MNDRNLVRGFFLATFALAFGLNALRYGIGTFSRAGPGLFPLMVSSLLLLIAVITIVRSRFVKRLPLAINLKNIALLLTALCAFAIVSKLLNMTAGIVAMVFIAALAGSTYSNVRNVKVAAGLVVMAFAFHQFLGLNLHLY